MSALPNKYIPVSHSLLGVAAFLADNIGTNDTVSTVWDRVRQDERIRTFDRYAEALTLLYAGGLLTLEKGTLRLKEPDRGARGQKSIGELEAERVSLESAIASKREEVEDFNVREDYQELQDRLSQVDRTLHDQINDNFSDKHLLQYYVESAAELPEADPQRPITILQNVGAVFREDALRKLEEVAEFHTEVHRNRAALLKGEIDRLQAAIEDRQISIDQLVSQKSDILQILKTRGVHRCLTKE